MSLYCFLVYIISSEKSWHFNIFFHLLKYSVSLSQAAFKILYHCDLIVMYLDSILMLGFGWNSWNCGFIIFSRLEIFQLLIFKVLFLSLLPLSPMCTLGLKKLCCQTMLCLVFVFFIFLSLLHFQLLLPKYP